MLLEGQVRYLDTFLDPSNMTRGMPLKRQKKLDRMLQSGKLVLRSNLEKKYQAESEQLHREPSGLEARNHETV
jgi:hypothetical protein